jgi:dTDP-4-dehydrorhamnose 3,5-epimerase
MDGVTTLTRLEPPLEGVTLTDLGQITDQRGSVLHMLRSDDPDFMHFGECYFSEVIPGAIKAWKCHRIQTQNVAVPVGRVRIAIYDDRNGSSTQGRVREFELGRPDAYYRLRIPPGLWYGFACLGQVTALLANCSDSPHDPGEVDRRELDDHRIPYRW